MTNFYGPVGTSQIQHQSPNALQITVSDNVVVDDSVYVQQVKALLPEIKSAFLKHPLEQTQADEAQAEVQTIEAQVRSPKPKRPVIEGSLGVIKRILESGAGSAAGQLIIEIGKLLIGALPK